MPLKNSKIQLTLSTRRGGLLRVLWRQCGGVAPWGARRKGRRERRGEIRIRARSGPGPGDGGPAPTRRFGGGGQRFGGFRRLARQNRGGGVVVRQRVGGAAADPNGRARTRDVSRRRTRSGRPPPRARDAPSAGAQRRRCARQGGRRCGCARAARGLQRRGRTRSGPAAPRFEFHPQQLFASRGRASAAVCAAPRHVRAASGALEPHSSDLAARRFAAGFASP
jgi:hypothetical protein